MTLLPEIPEDIAARVRSESARSAALARWRSTYKADRSRYAKAIRQGKPAPRVRKWKRRKRLRAAKNKV